MHDPFMLHLDDSNYKSLFPFAADVAREPPPLGASNCRHHRPLSTISRIRLLPPTALKC